MIADDVYKNEREYKISIKLYWYMQNETIKAKTRFIPYLNILGMLIKAVLISLA